jgi:hypothetical protein
MNWLDLFDDNAEADRAYHRTLARREATEPCEDDPEALHAAALSTTPEESSKEHGSPLYFSNVEIDRLIREAL